MISTRLHGLIDYAVAGLLGSLSTARDLPVPVRRVLGGAGAYHAAYSVLTDYEAGLHPSIGMRQHLALDVLGGAGLCAAGLLMERQTPATRALMFVAGIAELAVVARSKPDPVSGPGQGSWLATRLLGLDPEASARRVGYPPLDTLKPIAPDVYIVDGTMPGALGKALAVRMTVIRLPTGELLLHSPIEFSASVARQLAGIGRVRHLVAPSFAHWLFLKQWSRAFPNATTWAAPGLRDRAQVRKSGVRLDCDLGDTAPSAWRGVIDLVTVPGALGFREVALFHKPSRTLVLTDLVLNLEPKKLPLLIRPLARLFGSTAPGGMPPPYVRAIVKAGGAPARQAAARLIDLRPERVVFAHGRWFAGNGTALLRRSLRWLVG